MNKGGPIRIIANFLTETLNTKKAERHCHLDFYSNQSYVITEGESKPFCNKKNRLKEFMTTKTIYSIYRRFLNLLEEEEDIHPQDFRKQLTEMG